MTKLDRRTLPRTIKGAKRKGWVAVSFNRRYAEVPWLGFTAAIRHKAAGHVVSLYNGLGGGELLFENSADALFVSMQYNGVLV